MAQAVPVILIDICGTLFNSNTTFDYVDYVFKEDKRYHFKKVILNNIILRKLNSLIFRISGFDIKRYYLIRLLKGKSIEDLKAKVVLFYDEILRERRNVEVLEQINKMSGYKIIVSATLDIIAQEISSRMNVDAFFASKLAFLNNICTGNLLSDLLNNKDSILINNGIYPPYYAVISNDYTDIQLFKNSVNCFIVSKNKNISAWMKIINNESLNNVSIICLD